jgi:hypothetical protein
MGWRGGPSPGPKLAPPAPLIRSRHRSHSLSPFLSFSPPSLPPSQPPPPPNPELNDAATGSGPRLLLYSGHDTVLAPVLAAISGDGGGVLCGWPPYASRLVWEVWAKKGGGGGAADGAFGNWSPGGLRSNEPDMSQGAGGSAGAAGGAAMYNSSGRASGGESRQDEVHLRVLYNGRVITSHIAGCHGRNGRRQRKGGSAELARGAGEMCPLRNFERAMRRSMEISCSEAAA